MAWSIQGHTVEHCNCNSVCPCLTSGMARRADNDRCQGFLAFHVTSGEADDVDLSDRSIILAFDAPPNMAEGNWRVGIVIDDGASQEQAQALEHIFGGAAGGPMAELAGLIGESLGVERSPIAIERRDGTTTVSAGDLVDSEFQDEVQPGAEGPVQILNATAGGFGTVITVSPPTRSRIRAFGLDLDNSGRHGTTSNFSWSA